MPSATIRGRFVWHELMTTDTKRATAFYAKVIGWKPEPAPEASYTMLTGKSGPQAGLMALPEESRAMGAPAGWMVYIATPDVDATASQAAELGGKILRAPTDIPKVGRFAVLQDPQGAVFAAFTPTPGQGAMPDRKPGLGDFSWHELTTTDWEAALGFYQKLFGWQKTESMDMGAEMGTYQMYGWKGNTLGGMWNKPQSVAGPPFWLAYAIVPDTKATAEAVKKLGGTVVHGPMEVPGGDWMAQCLDPEGVLFAFSSRKLEAAKPAPAKPAPAKPAAKKAAKKVAKKKAARKVAKKKAARKVAKKKAARKVAKKKPARKAAKKRAARPRRARAAKRARARRPAARRVARKKGGAKKRRR